MMSFAEDVPKRERMILELLFRLGEASARLVYEQLEADLSYSSVRTFLNNLEQRGRISHRQEGLSFIYFPLVQAEDEGRKVLEDARTTFFKGSREKAIAALLGAEAEGIDDEEYERLRQLLDAARTGNKA